ncbi:MAG: helix-turn-helix domain-containing protein [Actinomycetia bacterium]|nr:helix-turn-helix domain-containing protein [Actinomycetes bacterium]
MVGVDSAEANETGRPRRANERIDALVDDPLIAEDLRRCAAERESRNRIYARGLAEIRKAGNMTQRELADLLGTDQGTVSRIERRDDLLLSTLRHYLVATGAEHPKIIAEKDGLEIVLDLDSFKDLP